MTFHKRISATRLCALEPACEYRRVYVFFFLTSSKSRVIEEKRNLDHVCVSRLREAQLARECACSRGRVDKQSVVIALRTDEEIATHFSVAHKYVFFFFATILEREEKFDKCVAIQP